ncbi:beta-ketoacyl synthase N-terminal-like domain-containing protein [Streptomyces sp. NPDC086549]|uniref:beta-ketoacyl synthase N-terminal-like domain-containing protein n=1 Tax=Streptomyces sp. NPDC086549 TaxID=3365752 RepID=UPI0037FCAFBF
MDNREILTRFKSGVLPREQAVALLTGALLVPAAPAVPPVAPEPPPARALTSVPAGGGGDDGGAHRYAITALYARFPHASGLDALWRDQLDGRDGTSAPPPGRPDGGPGWSGRFLDGVDEFDADFFGLEPRQAALMDPQERLLLETVWHTLETAGYAGARLDALTAADGEPRSIGLYVAAGPADYAVLAAERDFGQRGEARGEPGVEGCGAAEAVGLLASGDPAGRVSGLLDLRGPSQGVDTGEASFLTALHLALGALRAGECAAALVGAVDLRLHPARHGADRTEGVGAVLLRPLAAARAAGDTVHAVVRASAVGHTGRGTDRDAERVARRALAVAGVDASSIALRETRATTTAAVGDAGAATGLAALVRAVLQLRHATLLAERGASATEWPRRRDDEGRELPRRASVTVCGASGTLAGAVLEEYPRTGPPARPSAAERREELVLLSAPTPEHLARTAGRLAAALAPPGGSPGSVPDLAAVARELSLGRATLPCRLVVAARTTAELATSLAAFATDPGAASATTVPGADGGGLTAVFRAAGGVRAVDLRGRAGRAPLIVELPETEEYLAALWRGRRLEALARLWLAGVDVTPGDAKEPAPVVPLPPTAMLRRPLWIGGPNTDGPTS